MVPSRSTATRSATDLTAKRGVERGERLVEHHQRRCRGEGPGQGHPLLLATGELVGPRPLEAGQPDEGEALGDALGRGPAPREAEPDVRPHGEVGEERALLRHDPDPAPLGRHGRLDHGAVDLHGAGVLALEADHDAQQGGLAAARRPEHGGDGAERDGQVDAVEHPPGAERLRDAREAERDPVSCEHGRSGRPGRRAGR
jgi:hypothetical protein